VNSGRRIRPAVLRSGPVAPVRGARPARGAAGPRARTGSRPARPATSPARAGFRAGGMALEPAAGRAGLQLHARPPGGTTGWLAFRRAGRPARRPVHG